MPAAPAERDRLDFLDAVRGLAALVVVVEHGLHACVPNYLAFSRANVIVGQAAILVFFLVSGFVVPMSMEGGRSLGGFWLRRLFRLFPVYWLSIGAALAFLCAGGTGLSVRLADPGTWAANVILVQGWVNRPHVWGVFWTLPYELFVYAAASLLFACGLLGRTGARACVGVLAVVVVWGVARPLLVGKPAVIDGTRQSVLLCCVYGLMAYRYTAGRMSRRTFYGLVAGLVGVVAVVWAVNHAHFPAAVTAANLGRMALLGGLAAVFFFGLMELRHRQMPAVACWLGRRSYPIYLLHPLAMALLAGFDWSPWAYLPAMVCATLLLAAAAHRFVERPGIALGRRIERRRAAPVAVPIPVPVTEPARRAA